MKSDSITNRILFMLFLTIVSFGCKDATTTATAESTDLITEATESSTKLSSTSDPKDNGEVRFILDGVEWVSGPPGHPEMNFEEEAITDDKTMVRIEAYSADGSNRRRKSSGSARVRSISANPARAAAMSGSGGGGKF